MPLVTGWATNKGVVRDDNQDNCYVSVYENSMISAGIAVLCDGMGGLSDGAIASRMICEEFSFWFDKTFVSNRKSVSYGGKKIINDLSEILTESNKKLMEYGRKKRIRVGSTASALFMLDGKYYIVHAGDSRIYGYFSKLEQLTEDDCVAAEKLRKGEISPSEYEESTERHILTQCVGVNGTLNVHCYTGTYKPGGVFFLCSDGMYHHLEENELGSMLFSQKKEKGEQITATIEKTIDKMISRGEKDNITGVIVYVA